VATVFWGLGVASLLGANVILDWDAVMMSAIRLDNSGPTLSTRNLAILHVAMYDAVFSIERTHQECVVRVVPSPGASAEAAAVAAGREVLTALYPSVQAQTDALFAGWQRAAPPGAATEDGLRLGRSVAQVVLEARAGDGSTTEVPYIPDDEPGSWRRTPPTFRPPLTPHWRYVRPFAIAALEPFLPPRPPVLSSEAYATALEEVRAIGASNSAIRTPEQREIAIFWSDFSYTAMPPGHWQEIASTIARERGTDLPGTARLMALLSVAQADAAIVCWEAKYRYNLWRPVTAIQRADVDGNAASAADPQWDSLLAAPPFPAYPSGHSTFSKAGAVVLAGFYQTDAIRFTASSDASPGVRRSYSSLSACADEVGLSRIYGGIHFAFDNDAGKASGEGVARFVLANVMLPLDELPAVRLEAVEAGVAAIRVHGRIGTEVVLERSKDLVHWGAMATNRAVVGGSVVRLPMTGDAGFFRAFEAP